MKTPHVTLTSRISDGSVKSQWEADATTDVKRLGHLFGILAKNANALIDQVREAVSAQGKQHLEDFEIGLTEAAYSTIESEKSKVSAMLKNMRITE